MRDAIHPISISLLVMTKGETITKIEIELSTTVIKIRKWQGVFGFSIG